MKIGNKIKIINDKYFNGNYGTIEKIEKKVYTIKLDSFISRGKFNQKQLEVIK